MKKTGGLRKRWLRNTAGLVFILGLVCVFAVTAVFAGSYYSNMQWDLRYRAQMTSDFLRENMSMSYDAFFQSCTSYAQNFTDRDNISLQFIDAQGNLVSASYVQRAGEYTGTPEIQLAISTRGIQHYRGRDPGTGQRIMAVSAPMIYSNGEVIGVLRYVSPTRQVDWKIAQVLIIALAALAILVLVTVLSSSYYIRTILQPVAEITEKAKRIAGGTYGIQIQTKYDDEMGELVETINDMSAKINQNEMMQTEFISSLSHELRTPLTAITGWSETLLNGDSLDADTRRGMNIILREARRLTEMVVDLLDFTRIQDGAMTLNVELCDIRSEFEDTVYMYSSRLGQDGVSLHYLDNDDDIPEITCDGKRLRQVFLNILDNAAKHGGEGGRIEASIHAEEDFVVVRIRDFGAGIPEDEIPLVKKKFYKGSSKARGSGIGLAVCEEIVQMHGGELTLENAPEGGTLVTISLPVVQ